MSTEKSYSYARANFAQLLDQVVDEREAVVIKRRGHPDVALIAADDLRSMQEALYLVSSPANAERLLTSLERARGEPIEPSSVAVLRAEFGLNER